MLESLKNTLEKYSFRHTALPLSSLCVVPFSIRSLTLWLSEYFGSPNGAVGVYYYDPTFI